MPFTFKPLWKQLIDLDMSKKDFRDWIGISRSTMDRMSRDEYIALKIIDDICTKLNCTPNDVIRHVPEEE